MRSLVQQHDLLSKSRVGEEARVSLDLFIYGLGSCIARGLTVLEPKEAKPEFDFYSEVCKNQWQC